MVINIKNCRVEFVSRFFCLRLRRPQSSVNWETQTLIHDIENYS